MARVPGVVWLLSLTLLGACKTIQQAERDGSAAVYGGIRTWTAELQSVATQGPPCGSPSIYAVFVVVDVPLSFVADTLLLTGTVWPPRQAQPQPPSAPLSDPPQQEAHSADPRRSSRTRPRPRRAARSRWPHPWICLHLGPLRTAGARKGETDRSGSPRRTARTAVEPGQAGTTCLTSCPAFAPIAQAGAATGVTPAQVQSGDD